MSRSVTIKKKTQVGTQQQNNGDYWKEEKRQKPKRREKKRGQKTVKKKPTNKVKKQLKKHQSGSTTQISGSQGYTAVMGVRKKPLDRFSCV